MARKNALNFAKFHTRGGPRSPPGTPKERIPPTPGHRPCARARAATGGAGRGYSGRGGLPGHTPGGAATRRRAAYTGAARAATPAPAGRVRGYTGARGAAATRGGRIPGGGATGRGYTGARATRRAAWRHSLPPAARLPGGLPGRKMLISGAAGDGYTPLVITVGGYPGGATGGAGRTNIFPGGAAIPGKSPGRGLTRIYKKPFSGRGGGDTF